MARLHIFEFEDQQWFPTFIRDYGTDFLQYISNKTKLYKPIIPLLEKAIIESGTNQIIDLGSGGGGGLIWLSKELRKNNPALKIKLSDYYPNISAFEFTQKSVDNFSYISISVNAMKVPKELKGLRTQFLSFHHFKSHQAKMILQNAIDTDSSIAIFEAQDRSLQSLLKIMFIPIPVLLMSPFIRPFKIGRILFTYLIPIVPIFVLWDGLVSCLRTYSIKEMKDLVCSLNNGSNFNWKIGRKQSCTGVIMYLIGTKKHKA